MTSVDPADIDGLRALSALLDEALDLAPSERAAWLERLPDGQRRFRAALQEMLARAQDAADPGLIDFLPALSLTPPPSTADPALVPGTLVGNYRLLQTIGRGGMGTVWLAERADGLLRRQVALKLPIVSLPHRMLVQRFERERDILASLEHPNIARLYDAGVSDGGQPYLAMAFVQGEDLTRYCDERRLSVTERLGLFDQVLSAVQYAHANLVVHRDLKPANILVSADGRVHLLDFGIAKLLASDDRPGQPSDGAVTQHAGTALTPDYASPEQFLNEPVSIASDIYSLGILLFELLSGDRPYRMSSRSRAESEALIRSDHRTAPSAMLSADSAQKRGGKLKELARRLRGDLDNIVLKALKAKPAERYATVDAFAEDLHRWRTGQPVQARPDSRWYRLQRFVARNKLIFATGVTVVASLAVGLGLALWQAQVARTEAQIAKATEAFLVGIFDANSANQADPAKAQRTTARELLDLGAERIGHALNDAPEAKLRLLYTLADMYGSLELPEPGVRLVKQMAALRQQLHPGPTVERARDLMNIVSAGGNVSLPADELKAYVDEAESILDAQGDQTSAMRAQLWMVRAQAATPDWAACAKYARRAVEVARGLPPTNTIVDALFTYGRCEGVAGDAAAALASAQEGLKLIDSVVKSEYHRPLLLATVAMMQLRMGLLADSIASAKQVVRIEDAQSGAGPSVHSVEVLSDSLVAGAMPKEALAVLGPRIAWDLDHPAQADARMLARALDTRARVWLQVGHVEAAVHDLALAAPLMADLTGNSLQVYRLETLAATQLALGQLRQAECSLEQALSLRQARGEAKTTRMNYQTATRIALLLRTGRIDAAKAQLGSFVTESTVPGGVNRSALERQMLQAETAMAAGERAQAQALATDLLQQIQRSAQATYLRDLSARSLQLQGQAWLTMGQFALSHQALQQVVDLYTALYDPGRSMALADSLVMQANVARRSGRSDEAAHLARQARAIVKNRNVHPVLGAQDGCTH